MSGYFHKTAASEKINFLDSEVGLVLKTVQIDDTGVEADEYGYKIVKAGTIYPADDSTAVGIVFDDIDVTYGSKAGSVIAAGRVIKDRINISDSAVTALKNIVFCASCAADRTEEIQTEETGAEE